ncbi:MAG: NUDIX hydrolase, partial [Victivallales bacterium]|nr:NUDIX hydrolase [Victivallales bacterium]
EIVMVKQFRYGSKKTELEVPGGLVEQDESPVAAGVRELREETGYVGSSAALLGKVCPNPALQGNYCYTVLVENAELKHETEFDSAEDIETLLIPLEEFRLKILNSEITHGLTLNSLYFYDIEMMKQRMEQ